MPIVLLFPLYDLEHRTRLELKSRSYRKIPCHMSGGNDSAKPACHQTVTAASTNNIDAPLQFGAAIIRKSWWLVTKDVAFLFGSAHQAGQKQERRRTGGLL